MGNLAIPKKSKKPNVHTNIPFITNKNTYLVFHQNIRGLKNKADELLGSFHPITPYVLCITEHHMKAQELNCFHIQNYRLIAKYCRKNFEMGGVCIFVYNNIISTSIDIDKYCIDKDLEACAIKLELDSINFCILAIYRAPSSDYIQFLHNLEFILDSLYDPKTELLVCGDINVDYLVDSENKQLLDNLLLLYNLISIISFPTRISGGSCTAIDNIFVDLTQKERYTITPHINGLSDHEAQLLNVTTQTISGTKRYYTIRKINNQTLADFVTNLSYES